MLNEHELLKELTDELIMEAECHEWTMEQLDREIWSSE